MTKVELEYKKLPNIFSIKLLFDPKHRPGYKVVKMKQKKLANVRASFLATFGGQFAHGLTYKGDTAKCIRKVRKGKTGFYNCHQDQTAFNSPHYHPQTWSEKALLKSDLLSAYKNGWSLVDRAIRHQDLQFRKLIISFGHYEFARYTSFAGTRK